MKSLAIILVLTLTSVAHAGDVLVRIKSARGYCDYKVLKSPTTSKLLVTTFEHLTKVRATLILEENTDTENCHAYDSAELIINESISTKKDAQFTRRLLREIGLRSYTELTVDRSEIRDGELENFRVTRGDLNMATRALTNVVETTVERVTRFTLKLNDLEEYEELKRSLND